MGQILLSSIKNRVRYGFKEKKKSKRVWVGSGFYQKNPKPDPITMKLLKKPPYIYIAINTNPNSLIFQVMPPASSPSLPHFSSHLLSPHPYPSLPHTAHGLTPHVVTLRLTILSPTRMVVTPLTDSLSPTLTASLLLSRHNRSHQILQSPANVFPCWLSVRLICVNQNSDVFLRRSIQPSLSYTHCHGAYVAQRHRRQYRIRKNRNRDLLILFSVCVLCFFFFSKKYVLTEKSQKNKLICVSVYVWDCDCDLYFLF